MTNATQTVLQAITDHIHLAALYCARRGLAVTETTMARVMRRYTADQLRTHAETEKE